MFATYVCVMAFVVGHRGGVVGNGGRGVVGNRGRGVVGNGSSGVVGYRCGVVGYGSGLIMTNDALGRHGVAMSQETSVGSRQKGAESYDLKLNILVRIFYATKQTLFLSLKKI